MNRFTKLLMWIEEEALRLLTLHKKATSAVTTQTKTVPITLTMKRYTFYTGSNAAIISVAGNEINSLTSLTFKGFTSQEGRVIIVERWAPSQGEELMAKYRVFVAYGNDDDRQKLDAGQTVRITYNLDITATADITNIAINYVDVPEE